MSEATDRMDFLEARVDELTSKVDLLTIIAKKADSAGQQDEQQKSRKVTQINAGGKKYICETAEEETIFRENNPGMAIETYHIELPNHIIEGYLNDPENKKQFTKKETVNA